MRYDYELLREAGKPAKKGDDPIFLALLAGGIVAAICVLVVGYFFIG